MDSGLVRGQGALVRRSVVASRALFASVFIALGVIAGGGVARGDVVPVRQPAQLDPLDQPIEMSWPIERSWTEATERDYAEFIYSLSTAVANHRCRRLDDCLRDDTINTLYDGSDGRFRLTVDCADLPYVLRAYFAFKRRLPFGWVSHIQMPPTGRDPRYAVGITPSAWSAWHEYPTVRRMFAGVARSVHSGMYRTAPGIENSDFYQTAMNRRGVRPGTVFYDPNGHVLVVGDVRVDGTIYLMDGHPDGSLTWKRFGQAFVVGSARLGGGFKNFRPLTLQGTTVSRLPNAALPLYDGTSQFDANVFHPEGSRSTYHTWVRASLADAGTVIDPIADFRSQVRALCRDIVDRVEAVNIAMAAGLQLRPHPEALPSNIYGTDGDWELYSTPSRDARLKAAFRELFTAATGPGSASVAALSAAWREETARGECQFGYVNSTGATVNFGMDSVLDRLYVMSFDPYHCPELRWGAREGSAELAGCQDDASKRAWYRSEQRLRNRIDREYGVPTPLESGPEVATELDVRRVLGLSTEPVLTTASR